MHRLECMHTADHVTAASSLDTVLCVLPSHRWAEVKSASYACQLRCDCLSHVCAPSSASQTPMIYHPQSACICSNGFWGCCTTLSRVIAQHQILEKIAMFKTAEVWPWPAHVSYQVLAGVVHKLYLRSPQSPYRAPRPQFYQVSSIP